MVQEDGDSNGEKTDAKPTVSAAKEDTKQDTKKSEEENKTEEVVSVTAVDLWNEYDENEVSADQKYKGKQLEVTGEINDIGKDIIDSIYITLKTDDILGSVQVYFSDKDADSVAKFTKGQKVTIVGKGSGKTLTNVIVKKAQVK